MRLVARCPMCEKDEEIVEVYQASGDVRFKCGTISRIGRIGTIRMIRERR